VNLLTCVQTLPSDPAAGLRLAPFHGVRYAPGAVSGIANVTSPPYDVIGTGIREHLLSADPHNVIRLILPDAAPDASPDPAADAATRLREWLGSGVLVRDDRPGIYIYEQNDGSGVTQRGLTSLVEVGSGILPHENVMPGPVAGRHDLMAATQSNLEPIFLIYDGSADVARFVDEVTASRSPVLTAEVDGSVHRLWAVHDPAEVTLVTSGLAGRQALIADGHHRYAAYTQLRDEARGSGRGAGPWDYGLAFLVDSAAYPPRIGAVHRALPGLDVARAVALAGSAFAVRPLGDRLDEALRVLGSVASPAFVLAGDGRYWLITDPDRARLDAAMPPGTSARWRSLDAAVLQELLIGQVWGIEDNERDVLVFHDPVEAVRAGGTAVLAKPITFGTVRDIASRGERVPRKSTSFGPKPRTGLVLRYWGPASSLDSRPTRASSTDS
jgi:uncharacterized protein (DUF1015 family)